MIKSKISISSLILIIAAAGLIKAELPKYGDGIILEAKGVPIEMQVGCASPCVVDWNEDGKKDLIIGQFSGGKIRYYENIGSKANPKFGDYTFMKDDGEEISLEAS